MIPDVDYLEKSNNSLSLKIVDLSWLWGWKSKVHNTATDYRSGLVDQWGITGHETIQSIFKWWCTGWYGDDDDLWQAQDSVATFDCTGGEYPLWWV